MSSGPTASHLQGTPFVGVFSSADASALTEPNSRFTLTQPGDTNAITLTSSQQVVITDLAIIAGAALTVTVYDGGDTTVGTGETIQKGTFGAAGSLWTPLTVPHACQKGTYPKIQTGGAAQIDAVIRGVIAG